MPPSPSEDELALLVARLARLPPGYSEGTYAGRRYGITRRTAPDGRQEWLYAEQLGGPGRISCNLYHLAAGPVLKLCEMPRAAVIDFVRNVVPAIPPPPSPPPPPPAAPAPAAPAASAPPSRSRSP